MPGTRSDASGDVRAHCSELCFVKKLDEPSDTTERNSEQSEPITLNRLTIAGVDRGLTVDAIKEMEIGHIVDFIIEYNDIHDPDKQEKRQAQANTRKATQADWDAFWG